MLSNWWRSSSVARPPGLHQPFYVVPVAYDLVINRDPGSVQRGFGQSGLLPVLPLVYVAFPVLNSDTPQLLFQATPFFGLLLSFFTRSEIPRH
jgi:hypothetical protein